MGERQGIPGFKFKTGACRPDSPYQMAKGAAESTVQKGKQWDTPYQIAACAFGVIGGGELMYQLVERLPIPKWLQNINPWYWVRRYVVGGKTGQSSEQSPSQPAADKTVEGKTAQEREAPPPTDESSDSDYTFEIN